ncbi:MAG: hypothetical protein HYY50_02680 [Candidatus Kerfeldbacteria bacterium]|nr:hypothetical protein [Candidatus Kerfeldbacteria bacterium]
MKTVFFASLLALLAWTQASAQPAYYFQFFNFETNNYTESFPFGHSNEVVVASQGQDVRQQLPIDLSMSVNGQQRWTSTIANNPTQNCRGADGCSTRGPVTDDPGATAFVELTAKGKDGQTIATYTRGNRPTNTAVTNQPTTSTNRTTTTNRTTPATPTTSTTNRTTVTTQPTSTSQQADTSWHRRWWEVGFWVGIFWLFPWVFVGWQWTRYRFWGFGWPWPWWFWIPLWWFIPWFIIGWIWWLDWWPWWMWWWWLFPWIFWLFWWIILFKEAMIWHWRQNQSGNR